MKKSTLRVSHIIISVFFALSIAAFFCKGKFMPVKNKDSVMRMGIITSWKSLIPSLQHTRYADAIIGNIFETLVYTANGGLIYPKGALEWEILDNYTKFRFKIDTKRRFSNGDFLSASDYKSAWEHGLGLDPSSANSSLLDVFYNVVGFSEFSKTGSLKGVRVLANDLLEVEFVSPFRMALQHLSDNRYAAYKVREGKYLGTGAYSLSEDKGDFAKLQRNNFYAGEVPFETIECVLLENGTGAEEAMLSGKLDAFSYMGNGETNACFDENSSLKCLYGYDSFHRVIDINALPGRFFNDRRMRQAFQAMIWKGLYEDESLKGSRIFKLDPQVMLPMQAGRLAEDEAKKLALEGEKWIPELIEKTKSTPLMIVAARPYFKPLFSYLQKQGIRMNEKSGFFDFKVTLNMFYKTHEFDAYFAGFSVWHGDPDALYHRLGKNGAIASPIGYREKVGNLLEEGRKISDPKNLDPFYKDLTRAVLQEIPFIHLGFMPDQVVFNSTKMTALELTLQRKVENFTLFKPLE